MATRIYNKRRVGSETYSTEMLSSSVSRDLLGITNQCYVFHYNNSSIADSARQLDMCNMSTARRDNGQLPLFNMSGVIQVLPNGYVMTPRGYGKNCKNVYVVVFCRFGGQKQPTNAMTFEDTLAIPYSGGYGYKTMREAIDHARRHMINHYYAIRGVHGEGMANDMSLAHFTLKPYVKPVPAELVAAVAQVDAALATSPVDTDKYAAAVRRLEADCNALTAIHNASKPFATQVTAPCTNTVLSKSASAAVDKASVEIKATNAVLPNATWEDLKKLAFEIYSNECETIDMNADAEIAAINRRRQSQLKAEAEKKNAVVDLVCNRSKTVAARLESLNNVYWGYKAQLHGKNLDVYA